MHRLCVKMVCLLLLLLGDGAGICRAGDIRDLRLTPTSPREMRVDRETTSANEVARHNDEWAEESAEEDPCEDSSGNPSQPVNLELVARVLCGPARVVRPTAVSRTLRLPRAPPAALRS
jgi:hypothetical protein